MDARENAYYGFINVPVSLLLNNKQLLVCNYLFTSCILSQCRLMNKIAAHFIQYHVPYFVFIQHSFTAYEFWFECERGNEVGFPVV